MRIGSFEWWFRSRQTGRITIIQLPNWSLSAIAGGWLIRLMVSDDTPMHTGVGWTVTALWLYWGTDEIVRGVNPWRRVLGAFAVAGNVIGLLG